MSQSIRKPDEKEQVIGKLEEAIYLIEDWCSDMKWDLPDITNVTANILDVLEDLENFEPLIEGENA